MVDPDVVARKIAGAAARLKDLERLTDQPRSDFVRNLQARDLAAFYLFQAVQDCIDLASHWLADDGLPPSDSAGSTFDVLADHSLIPESLAAVMRAAVGLRNLIAHTYATIDHGRLYDEIRAGLGDLRSFLSLVAEAGGLE